MVLLVQGLLIGIGATVLLDLYNVALARFAGIPAPNWGMIGRWFWHLREGTVFHDSIAEAAPYDREVQLGWVMHYAVGAIYGLVLAVVMGAGWMAAPTVLPALILGWLTVGFGWFLLQPGLGLGWAASRAETPMKVRGLNLAAHTVFGVGLWLSALVV
ncbi:MAG: DUF2938 domain-containing protein [Pseudomonadota bacterium]